MKAMGDNSKYYYGFAGSRDKHMDSICIVPVGFWKKHRSKYGRYIEDGSMAFKIEEQGLMEVIENTFEFDTREFTKEKVKELMQGIGGLEYSQEFQDYLNSGV